MEHAFLFVEMPHIRANATLEVEVDLIAIALVGDMEPQPLGQVGHLAEALHYGAEVVVDPIFKDRDIRHEIDAGAAPHGAADHLDRPLRLANPVFLTPELAPGRNLDPHPSRERIDHAQADAM